MVSSQAARNFLGNLLHTPFPSQVVKDGDVIDLGGKHLRFIIAPFLHWPDTMFTLLEEDGALFTCDAFGAHYSWTSIFADQCPDYTGEIEFYFDCLIRPFKDKVLAAIEKIRGERLDLLCPSHGPVIRTEPWQTISAYERWSTPPDNGRKVLIFYLSPHGNTEKMAEAVARGASLPGVTVESCHITRHTATEMRDLMETADALIFGIPTINRDIPKPMWDLLANLSTVRLKAGIGGVFGSYGWSGEACRIAEERLKGLNFKLPAPFRQGSLHPPSRGAGAVRGVGPGCCRRSPEKIDEVDDNLPVLVYLGLGSFAGLLAGLLGVGGGIVIVPMLVFMFTWQHLPAPYIQHLALGTSMATIVVHLPFQRPCPPRPPGG